MKLVTAIITPHKVEEVRQALRTAGLRGLTIDEVQGFGRQGGKTELYRGSEHLVDLVPKARLETVVPDEVARQVADIIVATARTGNIGDGKIWISGIDTVIRVRTGEEDLDAL